MKPRIVIAALLLAASQASAQNFYNGNNILRFCESSETVDKAVCLGYVAAVFDVYRQSICTDGKIQLGQARDVAVRALRAAPEIRNKDADVLIAEALKSAWPCPTANPTRSNSTL